MTKERLNDIKEKFQDAGKMADSIMDGGENYDGADGAREVQSLCRAANELIAAVEPNATGMPTDGSL